MTAGIIAADTRRIKVTVNAYQKLYSDYPVSTDFPQLTMANIADTFGRAFLMFRCRVKVAESHAEWKQQWT